MESLNFLLPHVEVIDPAWWSASVVTVYFTLITKTSPVSASHLVIHLGQLMKMYCHNDPLGRDTDCEMSVPFTSARLPEFQSNKLKSYYQSNYYSLNSFFPSISMVITFVQF